MRNETLLHRQVNPAFVQLDRVTSQAFKPTPKDDRKLSVYDGEQISAEGAWRHFTDSLGYNSTGVLSVTVEECNSLELPSRQDPDPFPEHAIICFDNCASNREVEVKAKKLHHYALNRGWQYQAE